MFCFDRDVGYINISLIVILNAKTQYRAIQGNSNNLSRFVSRGKQSADSDLVDFSSGSTDSVIDFSGSADLRTPIHPPLFWSGYKFRGEASLRAY